MRQEQPIFQEKTHNELKRVLVLLKLDEKAQNAPFLLPNEKEQIAVTLKAHRYFLDSNHDTSLDYAVQLDAPELLKLIIDAGIDLKMHSSDAFLQTLHSPQLKNRMRLISLFLEGGVDINPNSPAGQNLFQQCIREPELYDLILRHRPQEINRQVILTYIDKNAAACLNKTVDISPARLGLSQGDMVAIKRHIKRRDPQSRALLAWLSPVTRQQIAYQTKRPSHRDSERVKEA